MKRLISLLLICAICCALCACGNDNESGNYEPTSAGDKITYALLKQCIPNDERDGTIDILAGGPCKIYKNYADGDLVSVTTYFISSKGELLPCVDYGLFDGTELIKYYDNVSEAAELDTATGGLEYSEFYISKDVCKAVGIDTYQEMWEPYVTSLAYDYLLSFMDDLKNPYTIEIHSVNWYVDTSLMYGYALPPLEYSEIYFTVNYTAENNLGGKVTTTIGNKKGLKVNYTTNFSGSYADSWYFVENETYAKNQLNSFSLNAKEIQAYILENY